MLYCSAIFPKIEKEAKLDSKTQYIFCSNHSSILDVPFMFYISKKPISFIGKESLAKIPIFGYYYRTFNVLVNRKSIRDSYMAFQKAGQQIKEGKNMVIFPEGGIIENKERLSRFKNGLFRLAIEENITIIPITFADNQYIFPASYIKGRPGKARVFIHKGVSSEGKEVETLKKEVYNIIDQQLIKYEN
jgi:1-acyl-sn-glycerol-3-phosphate acyltransferase